MSENSKPETTETESAPLVLSSKPQAFEGAPLILDQEDFSKYLGISPRTLKRRMDEDGYPHFFVGRKLRFDVRQTLEYIKNYTPSNGKPKNGTHPEPQPILGILNPVKIRAKKVVLLEHGPHEFHFGQKRLVRIPRMTYDVAHISFVDNEVGEWVDVTITVDATLVEQESLQDYVV